ncbi:excisionase family DNA-binding protein [Paludisphaera borealis]|uniref:HTH-type transcriptional repressor CarH n=1 Tax=Paludisphaera borealis TaxID=1387353 RepID=A0A1U7CPR9_9BACT|nr:excisionase family DNA-binding protein [Paludisphaera borealis]APW60909.1 HTH-type transcriptional repressor CarH [Paludisphaera borealis]
MKSSKPFLYRSLFMKPLDSLLRTHEVAERLQVSVSTVKRWVDSGTLQAVRTQGGHRQVAISEVDRMARRLARGGEAGVRAVSSRVDERSCELLVKLLRQGESRAAQDLVKTLSLQGCPAETLADDLVRPVMEQIGHGWLIGAIDVFEEHQASQSMAGALHELIAVQAGRPASGPLAIGATPEGDPYVLSCLLAELLLREQGWQVRNLGANLPLRSLANAAIAYRPKIVYLSINFVMDETLFARDFVRFHEAAVAVGAAVIVGGRALGAVLRSKLPYAAYAERMAHLLEFARSHWSEAALERTRDEA